MKTRGILLSTIFLLSSIATGGCTATPEAYHKASVRVSCRALKKCEEAAWKEAGFDNVGDCVDESLDLISESDFADACEDYDKKEARKCLASRRKAKRSCDEDDIDADACAKVCGPIPLPGELNPSEGGRAVAEAKFAAGEITEEELEAEEADLELAIEQDELDEALLQEEIDAVFAEED